MTDSPQTDTLRDRSRPAEQQAPLAQDDAIEIKAVPIRHWGRWVTAILIFFAVTAVIYSIARNPRLGWPIIGDYLFDGFILRGVLVTVELTVVAMAIGIVGGTLVAIMRQSGNPILSSVATGYIWFFRGTPVLVQLLFWYFFGAIYPRIFVGIPFTGILFFSIPANRLIGATSAAILGLGLNEVAYASELVRSGILSVGKGQVEASLSIGMSRWQSMRLVVLPQSMHVVIPPMGNETLTMVKSTALVVVISGSDLLSRVTQTYAQTFEEIPMLIVACIWYLALTTVLSIGQHYLEQHYGRGTGFQVR